MISRRRISRLLAIQACYLQYFCEEQKNNSIDNSILIEGIISLQDLSYLKKYDPELLNTLINNSSKNEIEETKIIENFLSKDWNIDRIDKLKLSILRNAICELKSYPETDFGIIINEYVTISRFFICEKDINFINGVLHRIFTQIRNPV